jgi:hypothetical protein
MAAMGVDMKRVRQGAVAATLLLALVLGGAIVGDARSGNDGQGLTIEQTRAVAEARTGSDDTPLLQIGAFVVTQADLQQRIAATEQERTWMQNQLASDSLDVNPAMRSVFQSSLELSDKYGVDAVALAKVITEYALADEAMRRGFSASLEDINQRVEHDRQVVEAGGAPDMAAFVAVIGVDRFWSTIYPATIERAIVTDALHAATLADVPTDQQVQAWSEVQRQAISNTKLTIIDPAALDDAALASALAVADEAQRLASLLTQ